MNSDSIAQHRQALHEAFFYDRDEELLEFLRGEDQAAEAQAKEELGKQIGTNDPQVIEALQRAGITSSSTAAFMLLPLVRLAWADSKIQNAEFDALLKASTEEGIAYGTPSYRLLSRWLEERPSEKVIEAWIKYAHAVAHELDEASLEAFREATLGRALRVAQASGGILGLSSKVSDNERHALSDLANALTKPSLS